MNAATSPGERGIDAAVSGELEHIWSRVERELAAAVEASTYRIWLAPLTARSLDDRHLVLEAPARSCGWIRERFGRVIHAAAARVLGPGAVVDVVAPPSSARFARAREATDDGLPTSDDVAQRGAAPASAAPVRPAVNPKLTFDQFVIGDCNRLAHAASLTVAELPAQAYNPLFICGPPGVGKTHLLSAIGALLSAHQPELIVRTTTGEAFTNGFLGALATRQVHTFKTHFRHADVLLVDDVQFLERKARTEEEFFHTLNALHDGGRQVVVTSDRPPSNLIALEDRLRDRFQAGLVTEAFPPDPATRLAILRKRVDHDRIELADDELLSVLAVRITDDVRSLEGALIRVVAFGSLTGRPLTSQLAREVLDNLHPAPARTQSATPTPSITDIQRATCAHFQLSADELLSASRAKHISWPRQLAMYLARELTDDSLPEIGRRFGGRDHTTVLHACRRITARMVSDVSSQQAVEKLRHELGAPHP
jgi:chromosomal replication initiator protein